MLLSLVAMEMQSCSATPAYRLQDSNEACWQSDRIPRSLTSVRLALDGYVQTCSACCTSQRIEDWRTGGWRARVPRLVWDESTTEPTRNWKHGQPRCRIDQAGRTNRGSKASCRLLFSVVQNWTVSGWRDRCNSAVCTSGPCLSAHCAGQRPWNLQCSCVMKQQCSLCRSTW